MNSILMFVGFVLLASTLAIAMWAFGRWLRSKGYGPLLDRLDRQCAALQLRVSPLALSASIHMFSGVQHMNRLPLLGSKSNADQAQQILVAIRAAQEAQRLDSPGNR
ncbi:TPA: hypothetical protein L4F23_000911 [Pseudomonas aeruginosa]|uniref:hypothetical protein n=1 Tax=Pseudomonas aeruginosa TaxID=287 RepID=UPI000FC410D0|nr:hypothetical protein [Pseudomonas aeruginosa]MEE3523072.1 hypothetical protein [Pseudomonas aeruginosa]NBK28515.1 hypothetical protein [Pseudomonas aeruginosa]NBY84338.1 hypothetical protein [Pseudomonas aeruginosa]NPX03785.1 hypothetical protein [Pseudomonas aeruginosa]RUK29183.1 hypothetical protein IPC245_12320 [Pseudomonas aeruginosa]